jgi:hypothetical protein
MWGRDLRVQQSLAIGSLGNNMITKILRDNSTGKSHTFYFEKEPTDDDKSAAIEAYLAQEQSKAVEPPPEPQEQGGFLEGIQNGLQTELDLAKRIGGNIGKVGDALKTRDPGAIGGAVVGNALRLVNDVVGTQLGLAAKGAVGVAEGIGNAIAPEVTQKINQGSQAVSDLTGRAFAALLNSKTVKEIKAKYDALPSEKDVEPGMWNQRPLTKEYVDNILSIAGSVPITKAVKAIQGVGKTAEELVMSQATKATENAMLPTKDLPYVGETLKDLASKSENVLLKPSQRDLNNGFDKNYMLEKGLGGNVHESKIKVKERIDQKWQEMKDVLGDSPKKITMDDYVDQTEKQILSDPVGTWGDMEGIQKALNKIREDNATLAKALQENPDYIKKMSTDELTEFKNIKTGYKIINETPAIAKSIDNAIKNGLVSLDKLREAGMIEDVIEEGVSPKLVLDLADANKIKIKVGKMGLWSTDDKGAAHIPADAKLIAKVYDKYYSNIKKGIEDNASGPVKEINKDLSKLIAIDQVIERRLPVFDRNEPVGLKTIMSMAGLAAYHNPVIAAGGVIANTYNSILKSGIAAQKMYSLGAGKSGVADALKTSIGNRLSTPIAAGSFTNAYTNERKNK